MDMATRNDTNDQINKTAEAGRNATEEAAHTARAVTDEAGKVGEQSARAAADLARQGAEAAQKNLQVGLDTVTQTFQRVADQFTQVLGFNGPQAEELARRSSQNLQAVAQANTILARGFQEASHEWNNLAQERLQKNMEGLNRLVGCRSVQEFLATQSDLIRDGLHQVIETNKRVGELSVRVAEEAARTIQGQADKNADRVRRVA